MMTKPRLPYFLCTLILGLSSMLVANKPINNPEPEILYAKYCGSCHGRKLESFKSRTWTMGQTEKAIIAVVQKGIADKGMPAFEKTINQKQSQELAAYIMTQSKLPQEMSKEVSLYSSREMRIGTETIFTEAQVPWDIESLPDSSLLISDRDGELFVWHQNGTSSTITGVPVVHSKGQGGLLDICLHPGFEKNRQLYISYSKPVVVDGKNWSTTAVIKATLGNGRLDNVVEIFEARPYFPTNHHYGSRMAFDKQGYLYISVGDRGRENENPQNLESDCGKTHRLKDDGSIPEDNPFYNTPKARKSIFTYGHRNPQGIAYEESTGKMWVNEHGPRGGDEVNILAAGNNYGWPITCYGINYDGSTITQDKTKEGITNPEVVWIPSIAPCDGSFVTSDMYYPWKGNFLVPSLSFSYLNRCIVKEGKVVDQEKLFEDIGRMRSIEEGNDGFIYIGLENPGRIVRLRPLW